MNPEGCRGYLRSGCLRAWLPGILMFVGLYFGSGSFGILGQHAPAWAARWPLMLRMSLFGLYCVGVTLLSTPGLRKLTGGWLSGVFAMDIANRLGANTILSILVFAATFFPVWYFFDWQYKKNNTPTR
jgi:hypothetical protein